MTRPVAGTARSAFRGAGRAVAGSESGNPRTTPPRIPAVSSARASGSATRMAANAANRTMPRHPSWRTRPKTRSRAEFRPCAPPSLSDLLFCCELLQGVYHTSRYGIYDTPRHTIRRKRRMLTREFIQAGRVTRRHPCATAWMGRAGGEGRHRREAPTTATGTRSSGPSGRSNSNTISARKGKPAEARLGLGCGMSSAVSGSVLRPALRR